MNTDAAVKQTIDKLKLSPTFNTTPDADTHDCVRICNLGDRDGLAQDPGAVSSDETCKAVSTGDTELEHRITSIRARSDEDRDHVFDTAADIVYLLDQAGMTAKSLAEQIGPPFDEATISKYAAIGRNEHLCNPAIRDNLPHGYTNLYALAPFKDRDQLDELIKVGKIRQDMTVNEANRLRPPGKRARRFTFELPKGESWSISRAKVESTEENLRWFHTGMKRGLIETN